MVNPVRHQVDKAPSSGIAKVIDGGYCVGCGGCGALKSTSQTKAAMVWNTDRWVASLDRSDTETAVLDEVCPFSTSKNETEIGAELFSGDASFDTRVGYYLDSFIGYADAGSWRSKGSSGGLTSWICAELLNSNLVDGIAHVGGLARGDEEEPLFGYSISRSVAELKTKSKSQYYPVEISKVISEIRDTPGRYGIVTIPCVAKAVRLLQAQEPVLRERIVFVVGIVCGHMKSSHFAESLAWQVGVPPDQLAMVDFRVKMPNARASSYGFSAISKQMDGATPDVSTARMSELVGHDWGAGAFRLPACDYCDDVFAETADIVFGDAWLPEIVDDWRGTNVVVVRNKVLHEILVRGMNDHSVSIERTTIDRAAQSQAGGLRHRRDGLKYRLWLKDKEKVWRPRKRVNAANDHLSSHLRKIYQYRIKVSRLSHSLFQSALLSGDLNVYTDAMKLEMRRYKRLAYGSVFSRAIRKATTIMARVRRKVASFRQGVH